MCFNYPVNHKMVKCKRIKQINLKSIIYNEKDRHTHYGASSLISNKNQILVWEKKKIIRCGCYISVTKKCIVKCVDKKNKTTHSQIRTTRTSQSTLDKLIPYVMEWMIEYVTPEELNEFPNNLQNGKFASSQW